jgi:hypothetical protein
VKRLRRAEQTLRKVLFLFKRSFTKYRIPGSLSVTELMCEVSGIPFLHLKANWWPRVWMGLFCSGTFHTEDVSRPSESIRFDHDHRTHVFLELGTGVTQMVLISEAEKMASERRSESSGNCRDLATKTDESQGWRWGGSTV